MCQCVDKNVVFHFFFKRGDRTFVVVFLSYGCLGIIQGLDTLSMRKKKTINVIENGTLDSKVREYDCRKMYHLVSFISGHNCCAYILKCTISQHLLLNLLLLITKVNNDTIYYIV